MFEVPGSGIANVHVTEEYVRGEAGPIYSDKCSDAQSGAERSEEDDLNTSIRVKQ